MSRWNDAELIDMISEVGHVIEFCFEGTIAPGNHQAAIPARTGMTCRQVRGYVVSKDTNIFINGTMARYGYLEAYILASDILDTEFSGNTYIKYDGRLYNIEYDNECRSQGTNLLHKLKLGSGQKATYDKTPESPDGVLRFPQL
jgi:hypothetical protein